MHMTNKKEIATLISIIFFLINGTLGFGGLYPIQFAMPFVLGAIFFLTRYFAGHSRDEAFILYGFAGAAGALFEARTLIFWVLSLGDNIRLQYCQQALCSWFLSSPLYYFW